MVSVTVTVMVPRTGTAGQGRGTQGTAATDRRAWARPGPGAAATAAYHVPVTVTSTSQITLSLTGGFRSVALVAGNLKSYGEDEGQAVLRLNPGLPVRASKLGDCEKKAKSIQSESPGPRTKVHMICTFFPEICIPVIYSTNISDNFANMDLRLEA